MSTAVQQCPINPCAQLRADRAKLAQLSDDAMLSSAVYEPDPSKRVLPEGYREIRDPDELNEMGLTLNDLEPSDSGFRSAVFQGPDGRNVVAFKGTTFTSYEDWKNNAQQEVAGESDYYTRAQDIGYAIQESDVPNISYTGHSLGGGLSSAAARRTGGNASTFNAAGLNPDTLQDRPGGGHIDRVYVKGDIVSGIQVGPASRAASDKDWALDPPQGIGARIKRAIGAGVGGFLGSLIGGNIGAVGGAAAVRGVMLHGMDAVHTSMAQKMASLNAEIEAKCGG